MADQKACKRDIFWSVGWIVFKFWSEDSLGIFHHPNNFWGKSIKQMTDF